LKRTSKVNWKGGDEKCKHDHLEDQAVPGNIVIYGTPYRLGKDGPLIEGKEYIPKRVRVICKDCGATAEVKNG
jgi:hypothetical protein